MMSKRKDSRETRAAIKPSREVLLAEAQRLGITEESAGMPLEELVQFALAHEDPWPVLDAYKPENAVESDEPGDDAPVTAVRIEQTGAVSKVLPMGTEADDGSFVLELTYDAPRPEEYVPRHCDLQLTPVQGRALRGLQRGLDADGARLANGRRIGSQADVIRWILDQVAAATSPKADAAG